uniref:peptidylprolyl isomerase n=1 Tax=Oryza glumipatula TaxID=40148 RepID=A0A0D9YYA6_9ORYZ
MAPPPISSSLSLMASNPIPSPPVAKPGRPLTVAACSNSSSSSSSSSPSSTSCSAAWSLPVATSAGRRGLLALGAGFLASAGLLCPAGDAGATRIEYYATVGDKLCDMNVVKSGLGYCDVEVGTGAQPPRGQLINVHYTARFTDGIVFDSTYKRGRPLTMRLGAGKILRGLEQGISGGGGVPPMLVGGKRKLMIPATLAYGPEPAGCFSVFRVNFGVSYKRRDYGQMKRKGATCLSPDAESKCVTGAPWVSNTQSTTFAICTKK